jgi:MFS family permease
MDRSQTEAARLPAARFGGGVLSLLALAVFVNYVDRGNLATAAPLIRGELRLSNIQYGLLVSAFFWVYTPGQILAAWFLQRSNSYRALAIGLLIWSAATVASGFAAGFIMLLICRVLLGLGESAVVPATSHLLSQHLVPGRLGKANAFVLSGAYLGPAAGTFVGGMFIALAGWRMLFIVFGVLSGLWLIPWIRSTRALSAEKPDVIANDAEPSWSQLLSNRQLWGASVGHFCSNYAFYLVLSWLPLYLVKSQGYSIAAMAQLGGLVYTLSMLVCLGAGWIADRLISRGAELNRVRMTMICTSHFLWFLCMIACGIGNNATAVVGLLVSSVAAGLGGFNLYVIGQTLAGPRAAGRWVGIQNSVGNVAGIVAPPITGALIDASGGYVSAFLMAGVVALVGAFSWMLVVRRVEPIDWVASKSSEVSV